MIAIVSTTCRNTHLPVPISFAASASWLWYRWRRCSCCLAEVLSAGPGKRFEEDRKRASLRDLSHIEKLVRCSQLPDRNA
ncbi:hypothetical protein FHS21_003264 [Phyllobacterium trifolii]|uniref:Uncharacterized protein n=1 Tax=Phyllobacterium trifolii TaxID=300193 RepID=A0A839U7W4_9HYPH|nr:hypothetical protein [Phyllobacterium trifolii]